MDRHEVPTHLDVEDRLFWGLTLPRFFGLMAALSAAYGIYARFPWDRLGLVESWEGGLRLGFPIGIAALGLALSLIRPSGRSLAAWTLDIARFAFSPRRYRQEASNRLEGRNDEAGQQVSE